jgi:hypothetical protein
LSTRKPFKKTPRISRVIAAKRAAVKRSRRRATEKQSQQYLDLVAPPSSRQASIYGELHRITLTLDAVTIERLKEVGGGSASDGARRLARWSGAGQPEAVVIAKSVAPKGEL